METENILKLFQKIKKKFYDNTFFKLKMEIRAFQSKVVFLKKFENFKFHF